MTGIKSINTVLIRVPKAYKETIRHGTLELYIDTRFDDITYTIRYGEVVSSPDERFREGDTIYFHHNIIRRIRTTTGVEKETPDEISDHIFHVPCDEIYARERGGKLEAIVPYCFIKPIKKQQETKGNLILYSKEEFEPQIGIVKYGNEQLEKMDVHEGDTIIFNKNSEYKYPIGDEMLYRMRNTWLIAKISGL